MNLSTCVPILQICLGATPPNLVPAALTLFVRNSLPLGFCVLVMLAGCSSLTRQNSSSDPSSDPSSGSSSGSSSTAQSPWWAKGDSLAAADTARTATTRTVGDTLTADENGPLLLADTRSGAGLDAVEPAGPQARPIHDTVAVGLSPEALAVLREAYAARTDAERDRVRSVNEYAIWCVENGMWDEARIHLEQAVQRDSLSASLNNNLGIIYERMGQRDEARIHYQKAADLNPRRRLYEANLRRLRSALEAPVPILPDSLAAEELLGPRSRGDRRPDVGATTYKAEDEAHRVLR